MDGLPDMHDGYFDGVWTSEIKLVDLFLRTDQGELATVVLKDVERMNVLDFRQGNIIFDVVLIDSDSLTINYIEELYEFSDSTKGQELLKNAQRRKLSVLTVSASYGAQCLRYSGA